MNGGHAAFFVRQSQIDTHYYPPKCRKFRQGKKIDKNLPKIRRSLRVTDREEEIDEIGRIVTFMISAPFIFIMGWLFGLYILPAVLGVPLVLYLRKKLKIHKAIRRKEDLTIDMQRS